MHSPTSSRRLTTPEAIAIRTTFAYDPLGQRLASQNANEAAWGVSTTQTYDALGRVLTRTSKENSSTWTYDSCTNGVGHLCSTQSTNQLRKDYAYDAVGRLSAKRVSGSTVSFPEAFAYDAATGRLTSRTYPTGLQVGYDYTALGYVSGLHLVTAATVSPLPHTVGGKAPGTANLAAGAKLWSNDVVNAAGATEQESYGNGVVSAAVYQARSGRLTGLSATGPGGKVTSQTYAWDSLTNLTMRSESAPGPNALTETFAYRSLSEILCARHSMMTRSMYAKQDEDEECGDRREDSGAAVDPQGAH